MVIPMSNVSEEGIAHVKQTACDTLLHQRTENKLHNKKSDDILSKVHLAQPVARDDKERPPHIPETFANVNKDLAKKRYEEWKYQVKLYKDLDPDYTGIDWKNEYIMDDPEWKHDKIPEIMDGRNVFDFWSENVDEKLEELEREEGARLRSLDELMKEEDVSKFKLTPEQQEKVRRIREKKKLLIHNSRLKRAIDQPRIPMKYNTKSLTISDMEAHLESLGMDPSAAAERLRSLSRDRSLTRGRRRERTSSEENRDVSKTPLPGEGYRNVKQRLFAEVLARKSQKAHQRDGRSGESDKHVFDLKPKHLFSGKSGFSNDRR